MNKAFYIHSSVATLKLNSSQQFTKVLLESGFLYAYIPSLVISQEESAHFDCQVTVSENSPQSVRLDYPRGYYESSNLDVKDVISLVEYMLERARQEKGVFCVHSSSVILKNKAVIFWGGATGMGKTQSALALAGTDAKNMYSDEKTLIDLRGCNVVGGINKIYLSKQYLKDKFRDVLFAEINSSHPDDTPISLMVYPFICEVKNVSVEKWDNNKYEWHLYEELCRKIRGTSRRFFDNSIPVDSLDTNTLAEKRIRLIRAFTKKIPNYAIKSDIENIPSTILKLL